MPRNKAFDPDQALQHAMMLFWEKGYEATSMQDLVERMGINRFSLYSTFGDKRQLFLTVLDRYRDLMVTRRFSVVEQPDASLPEIHSYFQGVIATINAFGLPGRGCLMTNTMTEPVRSDPVIENKVAGHVERLRVGFRQALSHAKARGELRPDVDLDAQARYLAVSVQGLNVYARVCREPRELQEYVDVVLSTLRL
jgi:TetR/AcrR family transcriptional regulator, transcriptional repressor for nem operon